MDNLYDNLDNYDDECLDELKKENTALKLKLQEYSNAMETLQKDFDNLSSEFKKLETNYSSLLKTAREEIERKTQIINKFNNERDMNVLNAIHNRSTRHLRKFTYPRTRNEEINSKEKSKDKTSEKMLDIINITTGDYERMLENRSSTERVSTSTDKSENNSRCIYKNVDKRSDNITGNSKENILQSPPKSKPTTDTTTTKASSIKNRRKSMPAIRAENLSSDEECKNNFPDTQSNSKPSFSRNESSKPYLERRYDNRHRYPHLEERYQRMSDTSSMADKYYSHYGFTNTYQSRRGRFFNTDKYRSNRDRLDNFYYNRNYSPERTKRFGKYRPDELFSRNQYRRYRGFESPPLDTLYHRNIEIHNHDKVEYEVIDEYQEKCTTKHKFHSDEGPTAKKQRTDSNNRQQEENNKQAVESDNLHNTAFDRLYEPQQSTCQSPDYIVPETSSTQPKEIMNTADTKLDDPRVKSKKYVLQPIADHVTLSTVTGRDVELKAVDTSKWNIKHIAIPKALTCRPTQCSDQMIKEIFMEAENPVANISIESGEIIEDVATEKSNVVNPKIIHDNESKPDLAFQLETKEDTVLAADNSKKVEGSKDTKSHSRTSKIKRLATKSESNGRTQTENMQLVEVNIHLNPADESHDLRTSKSPEKNILMQDVVDPQHLPQTNKDSAQELQHLNLCKEIVAGDLELSDETSDYIVSTKQTNNEKAVPDTSCHNVAVNMKTNIKDNVTNTVPEKEKLCLIISKKLIESSLSVKGDEAPDYQKKSKAKKRSHRSHSGYVKNVEADQSVDKKSKLRKEKKDACEIKSKFCELFGDSNSLITPEDLGIAVEHTPNISISEDAQDAVVLNDTDKLQCSLTEFKTADTVSVGTKNDTTNKVENKVKSKSSKSSSDSKKRKPKKAEQETSVSKDNLTLALQSSPGTEDSKEIKKNLPIIDSDIVKNLNKPSEIAAKLKSDEAINAGMSYKPDLLIKALATSTPQKEINPEISKNETSCHVQEIVCKVTGDQVENVDNISIAEQSFNNDTLDSQNTEDAPDVRIFVKRKRKIIKKLK